MKAWSYVSFTLHMDIVHPVIMLIVTYKIVIYGCSEANDESGPKTTELINTAPTPPVSVADKGNVSFSDQMPGVDEEGFSVRPHDTRTPGHDNSFDSSSDSDSGEFREQMTLVLDIIRSLCQNSRFMLQYYRIMLLSTTL